jgi:DNA topoisomerase-3
VNYRIEIDFRMGCAFTRYQTTTFGKKFNLKEKSVLSYGPCQMPTLGFVVDRYLEIRNFKPERYWMLEAEIVLDEDTIVEMKSERGSIKSEVNAHIIFANIYTRGGLEQNDEGMIKGKVLQRNKNEKKKYRPYPLTTVKFQKLATDKLKISSAEAMKIAEKLYMSGFISYPRTETNAFPATMHLPPLVKRLEGCSAYSSYVEGLLQGGKYMNPKIGNQNDQAHAPIHPVKPAEKASMTAEEWMVYDLITRHFLACCSKDAVGIESEIVAEISGEYFRASHLAIKEKNYL